MCPWIFAKSFWPVCETQERSQKERPLFFDKMAKNHDHVRHAGIGCKWTLAWAVRPRPPLSDNTKSLLVLRVTDKMGKVLDYYVTAPPTTVAKMSLPPAGKAAVLKFPVLGLKGNVIVRFDQFVVEAKGISGCPLPLPAINTLRQLSGEWLSALWWAW
jgi:hypothetical protein